MATVYSLVCWGGKDGKTVSGVVATDILTLTNHGMRTQQAVVAQSTVSGVTSGTTYYVNRINASTFYLYDTAANALSGTATGRVNITATTSFVVKSAYYVGLASKTRWTYNSVEYIFDGILSWRTYHTTTNPALSTDSHYCEIDEAFTEYFSTAQDIAVPAAETIIHTKINGVRSTTAWHGGSISTASVWYGYVLYSDNQNGYVQLTGTRHTLDGITVWNSYASGSPKTAFFNSGCIATTVKNCIFYSTGGGNNQTGFAIGGTSSGDVIGNIAYGFTTNGFLSAEYSGRGAMVANNLAVGCGTGFAMANTTTAQDVFGWYYNNMAVGNTTNWGAYRSVNFHGAGYNGGVSGNAPWYKTTDTGIKNLTASNATFVDYAGLNFRHATPGASAGYASEVGLNLVDFYSDLDMVAFERPSYVGTTSGTTVTAGSFIAGYSYTIATVGTTDFTLIGATASTVGITFRATGVGTGTGTATNAEKWDLGPFEYDWGYDRPLVRTIDFSGLVTGSQVIVYTSGTTTELFRDNNCSATESYDAGTDGVTVDYTILKLGYDPIRVTDVALTSTSTPVSVQQKVNRAWVASSGLTYTTDLLFTAGTPNTLKLRIASTLQNAAGCLYEAFLDSATNIALKNVSFPLESFGEASFTLLNGCEWRGWTVAGTGTSNTSIPLLSRDGMRYSTDGGVTITEIWAAILTLNTPAGQQVKYRQAVAGSIVSAATTGPMDQLVHIYSSGNFDYRGFMVLRAPKPGWSQPKPDLVATYGNLVDGLFVAALEPLLQYATTDAEISSTEMAMNNTTKITAVTVTPRTMLQLYQQAQWWANQNDQWDADIPLTTSDGSTFTQPSTWSMTGVALLSGGTLAGGTATLAAGTQGIGYNGVTMLLGAAGTYTFTADTCLVKPTPTAPSTYNFSSGTFLGTLTVNNLAAHAITIQIPAGVTTSTTGNTGGAITFTSPTLERGIAFTGLQTGTSVQVFTTGTQTKLFGDNSTAGSTFAFDDATAGTITVDYTIQKYGYLPIRVTGVALTGSVGGQLDVSVTQLTDRAALVGGSSGLTYGTNTVVTVGTNPTTAPGTKTFTQSIATTGQNWYSFWIEQWIDKGNATGEDLANVEFPLSANGPNSFTLNDGWTFSNGATSIAFLSRDGLRYLNTSDVLQKSWAAILTSGVPSGSQVRYQQSDAGTTVNAANTGEMDQLVQIYDVGVYDYRGYLVLKVQREGYDQAESNVVTLYGNLEDQLYVVGLTPTANGIATGDPALTITLERGTYNDVTSGKTFGVKIVSAASGTDILRELRYNFGAGGEYPAASGYDGFDWHNLVQTNGSAFKTVRGNLYGTAASKGVVVYSSGTTLHPDFDLFTADDGTTYSPPVAASISISGMPDAGAVPTRLQIINQTALTAAARANSTAYSVGAIRLRQTGIGTENTAGLYLRCTTSGTSAGSPPVWNTTPGGTTTDGTAVWTTYSVLYYDGDPAATSLADTYTNGEEFISGETVEVRFAEMNAGTSFKVFDTTTLASSAGFSAAVNEDADDVYASNALDGSSYEATFSPNFTSSYIVLDANTDFSGKAAYAYFCYTLTTSNGMYSFWGGVTALDAGNYRIESDILNLYFDESAGFVKQTDDVRIFRKDGTLPAIDPTTGGHGLEINWRTPVSVVTTGGSALTAPESAHLLSLSNAPSAATVAATVAAQTMGARTLAAHIQAQSAVLVGDESGAGTASVTFTDGAVTVTADVPLPGATGNRDNVVIGGV